MPSVPGLAEAQPLTHIEALDLDYAPSQLIRLGAGYVGLELAWAYRRFGSRVTVIETGQQRPITTVHARAPLLPTRVPRPIRCASIATDLDLRAHDIHRAWPTSHPRYAR
jgi:hypothetical protein